MKWRVQRGYSLWRAVNTQCPGPRIVCRCRWFPTWREAFDHANWMARTGQ